MRNKSDFKKATLRISLIVVLLFLVPWFIEHLSFDKVTTFFREGTAFERFGLLLFVILILPLLCERIGVPGMIGLVAAGVILGPHFMRIVDPKSPGSEMLYSLGKIFLMFVAGLEIDLKNFSKKKDRSIVFGILTFGIPLFAGTAIGRVFGYSWNTSVLIGSLFASHTLIGLPIIQKLKLVTKEFFSVTIGATMFTDIVALFVLALCITVHMGSFSWTLLGVEILESVVYCFIVLVGFSWLSESVLKHRLKTQESQFIFVFAILVIASIGAQIINLEGIVGAFLAGIAVNRALRGSPVREKLHFLAAALFVPAFFIMIGLRIDLYEMESDMLAHLGLISAIVVVFFLAKYAAAYIVGKIYKYSKDETLEIWSLTIPQVAATLTAAFVAYEKKNAAGVRLIDQSILYAVFVLLIITVITGPVLTERFGKRIVSKEKDADNQ